MTHPFVRLMLMKSIMDCAPAEWLLFEIPYANKCLESSTQQQLHVQTYPVIIISDLSQSSPLEDTDGVLLSYESTEGTSFQASCNTKL